MSRAGELVTLGPFSGGLNNLSDPVAIDESELDTLINMNIELDGTLVQRSGFENVEGAPHSQTLHASMDNNMTMIGSAILGGFGYMFARKSGTGIFYKKEGTATWGQVTATAQDSNVALPYRDKVYFAGLLGVSYWDGSTFTTSASTPISYTGIFYKSRLWTVGGASTTRSRLYFSNPMTADSPVFDSTDFIDISPGDGQVITSLFVYQGNLLIVKNNSMFVLAYDILPTEGLVENVHPTLGADIFNIVQHENTIYFHNRSSVYAMSNYTVEKLNLRCPFETGTDVSPIYPTVLSLFGDGLVLYHYGKIYYYGLRTQAWSEWLLFSVSQHYGPFVEFKFNNSQPEEDSYYTGSQETSANDVYIVKVNGEMAVRDITSNGTTIVISCSIKTKVYNFGAPHRLKKHMWWGIDVFTDQEVSGTVTFITDPSVTDATDQANYTVDARRYLRYPGTARFREIYYSLTLEASTVNGSPARLFAITAMLGAGGRQTVTKDVN